jgi:hypothetical protein
MTRLQKLEHERDLAREAYWAKQDELKKALKDVKDRLEDHPYVVSAWVIVESAGKIYAHADNCVIRYTRSGEGWLVATSTNQIPEDAMDWHNHILNVLEET